MIVAYMFQSNCGRIYLVSPGERVTLYINLVYVHMVKRGIYMYCFKYISILKIAIQLFLSVVGCYISQVFPVFVNILWLMAPVPYLDIIHHCPTLSTALFYVFYVVWFVRKFRKLGFCALMVNIVNDTYRSYSLLISRMVRHGPTRTFNIVRAASLKQTKARGHQLSIGSSVVVYR